MKPFIVGAVVVALGIGYALCTVLADIRALQRDAAWCVVYEPLATERQPDVCLGEKEY